MEIKKITIRGKEVPPFYRMKTSNEINNLKISDLVPQRFGNYSNCLMCPFTQYIPLSYIISGLREYPLLPMNRNTACNIMARMSNKKIKSKNIDNFIEKVKKSPLISKFIQLSRSEDIDLFIDQVFETFNFELNRDANLGIGNIVNSLFDNERSFFNVGLRTKHGRNYSYVLGDLSIYRTEQHTQYIPHIVATVLPENYLYQKYNVLLGRGIDLSKVIILVDRELDTTEFPIKPLRALYKKEIEPELAKLSCNVWKVPIDYIKETCFIQNHKLMSKSIVEIKKEVEELINMFKNSYKSPKEIKWTGADLYMPRLESSNDLQTEIANYQQELNRQIGIDTHREQQEMNRLQEIQSNRSSSNINAFSVEDFATIQSSSSITIVNPTE